MFWNHQSFWPIVLSKWFNFYDIFQKKFVTLFSVMTRVSFFFSNGRIYLCKYKTYFGCFKWKSYFNLVMMGTPTDLCVKHLTKFAQLCLRHSSQRISLVTHHGRNISSDALRTHKMAAMMDDVTLVTFMGSQLLSAINFSNQLIRQNGLLLVTDFYSTFLSYFLQ